MTKQPNISDSIDFESVYRTEGIDLHRRNTESKWMIGLCPFHDDHTPSFYVDITSGGFNCFGCSEKGSAVDFIMKMRGVDRETARNIELEQGRADRMTAQATQQERSQSDAIVKTYPYHDENGDIRYEVCRLEPKRFLQRRPDGKDGWIWNTKGIEPVLYRLPEVIAAGHIVICEGEKDADNLKSIGIMTTTAPGGAGKWREDYTTYLENKRVTILPDNDEVGHNHARKVARALAGVVAELKIVTLPDLPDKGDVSDWLESGGTREQLLEIIDKTANWVPYEEIYNGEAENDSWALAKRLFPRIEYPWDVFPEPIATSIQRLAVSTASSPTPLAGVAIAVFASVLGRSLNVSPKKDWNEPLIFWFADIRKSGDGKTPAARKLCQILYRAQKALDEEYEQRLDAENLKAPQERQAVPRPRSLFLTHFTIEGLRSDAAHSHGGVVVILDEFSALITGQNQYKGGKGDDREVWITLWEGDPARVARAKESMFINGVRVSIFGGIQPGVWQRTFTSNGGLFLQDGTIFRILPVIQESRFYPLTQDEWGDEHKAVWEHTLESAMAWADRVIAGDRWTPQKLLLDHDARERFLEFRNKLYQNKFDLPDEIAGFIPKAVSYTVRFTGIFHCMDRFSNGRPPGDRITLTDLEKGIQAAYFYLGQIVDAAYTLSHPDSPPLFNIDRQVIHLVRTLENLREKTDSGRLSVKYIWECFNIGLPESEQVNNPKAMGSLLRKWELTISSGKLRFRKKSGVRCLLWDQRTEDLIDHVRNVRDVNKASIHDGLQEVTSSRQSLSSQHSERGNGDVEDMAERMSTAVDYDQTGPSGHVGHDRHGFQGGIPTKEGFI